MWSVLLGLLVPGDACLSITLATHDRVVVDPKSLSWKSRPRECLSTEGPFCPSLGAAATADEGLTARMLFEGLHSEGIVHFGNSVGLEQFVEMPRPAELEEPAETLDMWHMTAALDLTRLMPGIDRLPDDFSAGMLPRHEVQWTGHWRVTTGLTDKNTALHLVGPGTIRFSRALVVSELLLRSERAVLVIGNLDGVAVWRRKITDHLRWNNGVSGVLAVDELVILPIDGVFLGGLVVIASMSNSHSPLVEDGFVRNTNSVPVTLIHGERGESAHTHAKMARLSISPSAPVFSLHEAWHRGLAIESSPDEFLDIMDEPPSLLSLKSMLDSLQSGMELPTAITVDMVNEETEVFHSVLQEHAAEKDIASWWRRVWETHRFYVLEVCFLMWSEFGESDPKSVLEALVGDDTANVLNGALKRMVASGDGQLVQEFENAINALGMDVVQFEVDVNGDFEGENFREQLAEQITSALRAGSEDGADWAGGAFGDAEFTADDLDMGSLMSMLQNSLGQVGDQLDGDGQNRFQFVVSTLPVGNKKNGGEDRDVDVDEKEAMQQDLHEYVKMLQAAKQKQSHAGKLEDVPGQDADEIHDGDTSDLMGL